MDRRDLRKAHARRMLRERALLSRIDTACTNVALSDAHGGAQAIVDEAIDAEYKIAALRTAQSCGVQISKLAVERLTNVRAAHRIGKLDDPARLAQRARMLAVSAMTAARTAGVLDYLDAIRSAKTVEAAAKARKRSKRLTKEWVSLGDAKTCEECEEIDGDVVNAYSNFRLNDARTPRAADYYGDSIEGPPLHPSCRCDLLIAKA